MSLKGNKFKAEPKRLIEGVQVKSLRWIADERGKLLEMLRADEPLFQKFGQVYVTTGFPGVVKAWHYHQKQTDFLVVIKGMARLALYDPREGSATKGLLNDFFMGEDSPMLVAVPPLVIHGFKAYGAEPAYVMNCVTEPYNHRDPDEFRLEPFTKEIPYDWSQRHG